MATDTSVTESDTTIFDDQSTGRFGDAAFRGLSLGSALLILGALAGVGIFLLVEGMPALGYSGDAVYGESSIWAYSLPLLFGTVVAALIAMIIATPLAIGVALVISHYAPRRLAKGLGALIDLLAAIPSVVYGLWGLTFLAPAIFPVFQWLQRNLGFLPFFEGPVTTGRTIFTAGVVLAIMALPIITAICREVFLQTPTTHQEAALALGATRWEMIRLTVFPYARSGVISAVMLGLGRALGETMAVALVLAVTGNGVVTSNLISSQNPSTIAANVALNFGNASGPKVDTLIFTGLLLFLLTFAVNFAGRAIATRGQARG
ncbi:phosphate ABC transporter permease subunit PstC [Nocardioides salsibiostraticola]